MLAALAVAGVLTTPPVDGGACLTANGLSPAAGQGDAVAFEARYGHCEGAATFRVVQLWIGDEVTPESTRVNLGYEAGRFFLEGAAGDCAPGDAMTLVSTHGSFDCAGSTVSQAGNELLVRWSVAFDTAVFAGPHGVFFDAKGGAGDPEPRLGWTQVGTFEVGEAAADDSGGAAATTTTSGSEDGSGGDDSSTSAGDVATTGTTGPSGLPGAQPDRGGATSGCSCRADASSGAWWLALVIAIARRRRR